MENFSTRDAALRAEEKAVKNEKPLHNISLQFRPADKKEERKITIDSDACICARNLLRLTRPQLAEQAGIAAVTLKMYEEGKRTTAATEEKLRAAFDANGVTFANGHRVQTIKRTKE